MITGGCACGDVRYEGTQAPDFSFLCQCRSCQYQTGAGHTAAFVCQSDDLTVTGALSQWARTTPSGAAVTIFRCARCGTPIYNTTSSMEGRMMINAASLSDPAQFTPQRIVHAHEAQPWDTITLPEHSGESQ